MICDQDAILCTPDEYWRATVFPDAISLNNQYWKYSGSLEESVPISANFLSSKITKSCLVLSSCIFSMTSGVKSSKISMWVLAAVSLMRTNIYIGGEMIACLYETDVRADGVEYDEDVGTFREVDAHGQI